MTVQSFNFDILSMIKNLDIQIHYLAMNMGGIRDSVEYHEIEMKPDINRIRYFTVFDQELSE